MTYPCEWSASTDLSDESGTATFTVEGVKRTLRLENFKAFQAVSAMLDATFKQGKVFAAVAMRSHIERALDDAVTHHELS